jgi:hypothetical protein
MLPARSAPQPANGLPGRVARRGVGVDRRGLGSMELPDRCGAARPHEVETMKNFVLVALAVVMLWPAAATAQPTRGRATGRDDKVDRISRIIGDCERRTNDLKQAVNRAWGRGDRRNNDELDRNAILLERALNRVRVTWDRAHEYQRTRGTIGPAIEAGRAVNRTLSGHRLSSRLIQEWKAIKSELMNLAEIFEQPPIRWDR